MGVRSGKFRSLLVIAEMAGAQPWSRLHAPRRLRFWSVMLAVAASLPIFISIKPLASLLMLQSIAPADWSLALVAAAGAVGWRACGHKAAELSNNAQYSSTIARNHARTR